MKYFIRCKLPCTIIFIGISNIFYDGEIHICIYRYIHKILYTDTHIHHRLDTLALRKLAETSCKKSEQVSFHWNCVWKAIDSLKQSPPQIFLEGSQNWKMAACCKFLTLNSTKPTKINKKIEKLFESKIQRYTTMEEYYVSSMHHFYPLQVILKFSCFSCLG